MTEWTDERIVARLSVTFTAHEAAADPDVARQIARMTEPAHRRRWPLLLAAAAVVAFAAGPTLYVAHTTGSKPAAVAPSSPIVRPVPTSTGTNRHLAVAEATRVLGSVPVPPGSTRSGSAPAPWLRQLRMQIGFMDPSLTQTNWWVVPLPYRGLVAWYDAHTPADVDSTHAADSRSPLTQSNFAWQTHDTSPAYSTPDIAVSYARLGADSTAIRTDVTLAARYDRTARTMASTSVTTIDITRSAIDGPRTPPTRVKISDPALIGTIVSAFNNLEGAFAHPAPIPCGSPAGLIHVYAVTFHWPGHRLAVDPGAPLCGIGMGLTLDHTKLPQTLADDDVFDRALQAAFPAS